MNFDHIWDELHSQLYWAISKKVSNKADVDDLLQNIYIKIYQKIDQIQDEAKLKSWVYSITKNTIADYYRTKKDATIDIEKMQLSEPESSENMNDEILSCLEKFIFLLSSNDKEIINLYHFEKLKHKEISKQLGVSISTSKMRLKRAKERLKGFLNECCDFDIDVYGNVVEYKNKKSNCNDCECD